MESGFVVGMLPDLERLACAFHSALYDNALDREDLVQEGVLKLLMTEAKVINEDDMRRFAVRVFMNQCRDFERRAIRRYRQRYVEVDDATLEELPGPYSFASLLTKLAIEECLLTIGEVERSLVMEFIEPTRPVAEAAVRRIHQGRGVCPSITPGDIAKGRCVSRSTVRRAVDRARYALLTGGFRSCP